MVQFYTGGWSKGMSPKPDFYVKNFKPGKLQETRAIGDNQKMAGL